MRRLVATLACRNEGSRLYGKPLQNLDIPGRVSILEHMADLIATVPEIAATVLGIAEGEANLTFAAFARRNGLACITGSEKDVLARLIACCEQGGGTDAFRVTTESPFFHFEMVGQVWQRHLEANNDVTVVDGLPEGCHFEIYTLDALRRSHDLGDERHRSEFCSLYIRENRADFRVEALPIAPEVERLDLRLTVDYPEDLIVCRAVYAQLKHLAPRIPVAEIVRFLDSRQDLTALVEPYVVPERLW